MSEIIAVTGNLPRLIQAVGASFTNSTTFIFELIQNAERSGATKVEVTVDIEASVLTVEDDGEGIADPAKLLALAESGWSPEIMASRHPYGMGFISAWFAAEEIEVRSRDFRLAAKTADLRAMQSVEIQRLPVEVKGTRVTLRGLRPTLNKRQIHEEFQERLWGFPIPVVLNGLKIRRPYALGKNGWHETAIGLMQLDLSTPPRNALLMLQGMAFSPPATPPAIAVHLDPSRFFGRLPDRTALIDALEAERAVHQEARQLARRLLEAEKASSPAEKFVGQRGRACLDWECADLLNDLPFVPADCLTKWDGLPQLQSTWDANERFTDYAGAHEVIHQDRLPRFLLPESLDEDLEESVGVWPLMVYAALKGWPIVVESRFHHDHWLKQRQLDSLSTDDLGFSIEVKGIGLKGKGTLRRKYYCDLDVDLYERIVLVGPDGEVELPPEYGLLNKDQDELMVLQGTCPEVLKQSNTYREDDEDLDEAFDEDADRFYRLKRALLGEKPNDVLTTALRDAGIYEEVAELLKQGPLVLHQEGGNIVVSSTRG